MYVCSALDPSGVCLSWAPLPSLLPSLSASDALTILTAAAALLAVVWGWRAVRRLL